MSLEATGLAEEQRATESSQDRRARSERRGRDRRKPGARVNKEAPRRSLMKAMGAFLTAITFAVFAIVFLAGEMLFDSAPMGALLFAGAGVILSAFALMIGCIEQRLIEIRLELMMVNGGMRQADRRSDERRGT